MKKLNALTIALFLTLGLSVAVEVRAQDQSTESQTPLRRAQQEQQSLNGRQQPERRPNLLQLLNLTPDQVRQIRVINQETRETARSANIRQRTARRALDAAIYADAPNEAEVDERARELGDAQADVIKTRASIEFRIRQVLTTEQLIRFRALRQQFEQKLRQRLPWQQMAPRKFNKPL